MWQTDVIVVGAGQAGLSSAYALRRWGVEHRVLDANPLPGGAWQHRWPTLRMATVHGIFDLPGMRFYPPDLDEPAATVVPAYFAAYEKEFELDVVRPVTVRRVSYAEGNRPPKKADDARLLVETDEGTWETRALINATGTWTKPFRPSYPGAEAFAGEQPHTVDYRGPEPMRGKRVVVVGGGTSAVQLLMEIADVAADTLWVTRRPPAFRDEPFTADYGREVVAAVDERVRAGLPPESVVRATELPLTPEMRDAVERGVLVRHPVFDRISERAVHWDDGGSWEADVILWCTGWRAALDHLAPLRLREPGGGIRMDGARVLAEPRVHLVGYGPSASTVGANRAGRAAVRDLRRLLPALRERPPSI